MNSNATYPSRPMDAVHQAERIGQMLHHRQRHEAVDTVCREGQSLHTAHDVNRFIVKKVKSDDVGMNPPRAGSEVHDDAFGGIDILNNDLPRIERKNRRNKIDHQVIFRAQELLEPFLNPGLGGFMDGRYIKIDFAPADWEGAAAILADERLVHMVERATACRALQNVQPPHELFWKLVWRATLHDFPIMVLRSARQRGAFLHASHSCPALA